MRKNVCRIEKVAFLVILMGVLGVAASRVQSFDIFWQLHSGRYMLDAGEVIRSDIFSLAADVPRWEHCWLHDVLFFAAFSLLGYAGVSLLKGSLIAATFAVLVAAARARGSSFPAIFLVGVAPFLWTDWAWLDRPQLWSYFLFGVFIWALERFRGDSLRLYWLLFSALVLWANLHGGFLLAFAVLGAYLVGYGGDALLGRSTLPAGMYRRLWLALPLLLFAACLTPYGFEFLRNILFAAGVDSDARAVTQIYNVDWRATTFNAYPEYYYAIGGAIFLMVVGWRRLSLRDLFLLGGLAVMGLQLERHTPFFLLGVVVIMPSYADAVFRFWGGRTPERWRWCGRLVWVIAICWILGRLWIPLYQSRGFFDLGLTSWHYPQAGARFIKEHRLPPNLFNGYGWGGYLMWTLYPDYLVFWDGRADSPKMFSAGLTISGGRRGWQEVLHQHQVNTIIVEACTYDDGRRHPLLDRLRGHPDWTLVFADEASLVFVRNRTIDAKWLKQYRLPDSRIDDAILSMARLLTESGPWRYRAYWEMARLYVERGEYEKAFPPLVQYLRRAPAAKREPAAELYYRRLLPVVSGAGGPG